MERVAEFVRLLDRYIGGTILRQSMLVFIVLMGIFLFMVFIEELADIGVGNYDLAAVFRFVALSAPRIAYEIFPMVALIGAILGLSSLALSSELIVVRASGVSLARITGSVLRIGAFFMVVVILVGEFVNPWSQSAAQRGRAEALERAIDQDNSFGLWIRDGRKYVNVGEVLPDLTLLRIRIFEFDDANRLVSMQYAGRGRYRDNVWQLLNLRKTTITAEGDSVVEALNQGEWQTAMTPQMMSAFLITPEQLSIQQLRQYMMYLKENSQDTRPYQLANWQKLTLPLSTAVMVVLAIPFVFGNLRSGSMGRNLFIGIMVGLVFYVVNKAFGYIVLGYGVSPIIGAGLPTLTLFIVALFMYRRVS
jgi:lipopolysaccharide export system permease protein